MRFNSVGIALGAALWLTAAPRTLADDCAASTQAGMSECARRELQDADAALNAAYGRLHVRLINRPGVQQRLVEAQRSWIAFRDEECAFSASGVEGGSAQPMVDPMCRARITQARTEDLGRYLDCREGDLACPAPGP